MKNIFKKMLKVKKLAKVLAIFGVALVALQLVPGGLTFAETTNEQPIFRGEYDFYKVKNVTQGGSFGNDVSFKKGDVLEFKLYVLNAAPGSLAHDVMVRAQLPAQASSSFQSTGQIACKEALHPIVNDTATLHGPNGQALDYQEGSTWMHKRLGNGASEDTKLNDNILNQNDWYVNIGNVRGGNGEDWGVDVYFRVKAGDAEEPQEDYSVNIEPDRNGQDYAGHEVAYNHTITNTGNTTDSYNISAESSRGWNVRLSKNTTNPTEPNQSRDLTVWVTIPYGAAANAVDNTVVTVTSQARSGISDRVTDRTTVLERQIDEAELVLTETVDKDEVQRDNPDNDARNLRYTMRITNIGNKAAVGTVLTSDLGDNLEGNANFISYGGAARDGNNLVYRIGRIEPGQTVEKWFIADAHNDLTDGFRLRNRSMVSYDQESNNVAEPINPRQVMDALAWSEYVYTIVRGSGLDLSVTDNKTTASRNDTLNYEVSFANTGSGIAYQVNLDNVVPNDVENIRNISDNGIYDESARTIHWNGRAVRGNARHTFTFSATVSPSAANGTVLTDTATASANNVPSVSASDNTLVQAAARLELIETVDKTDVERDDPTPGANEVTYNLTLTNNGDEAANNVIVRSDLTSILQSATMIDLGGGTVDSNNVLSFAPVNMNVGDIVTFTFRAQVNSNAIDGAVMTNQSTAEYEVGFPEGVALAIIRSNTVSTTIHAPFLTLTKTDNKETTQPGDTSTYEVRIVNTGTGKAYEVNVVDYLPQYLENITNISDGGSYDATNHTVNWSGLTIDGVSDDSVSAQTVKVLTFEGEVSANAPHGSILLNRAVLNARNIVQLEATDETLVVAEPVLDLSKQVAVNGTDRATARPGDTLTYTIFYGNSGLGAAGNVVILDQLPNYVTYVSGSASNSGVYDGLNRTITWNIGNLVVGQTGSVTFEVTVDSNVPHNSTIRNIATITADGGFENEAFVDILAEQLPALFVRKSVDKTTTKPGDILTYTVRYGNNSPYVSAFNAVLTDDLSGYVTYVSGSATQSGVYNSTNHTLTWNLGTLPPQSSGTVTYQVRVNSDVPNGAIIENTATLTANYVDPVRHTVETLSEKGTVKGQVITKVSFPGSLTKTGVGLIGLIALAITFLITLAVTSPRFKDYLARLQHKR